MEDVIRPKTTPQTEQGSQIMKKQIPYIERGRSTVGYRRVYAAV